MRYGLQIALLSALASLPVWSQTTTTAPKKAQEKKAAPKAAVAAAPVKKAAPAAAKAAAPKTAVSPKTAASQKGKSTKKPVLAAAPGYRQLAPTPDRYKEIQQALAEKGYLKTEPNGVWDNDSMEAMKQFQSDRQLPPTGKLTSASLIGLGLGPKNTASLSDAPILPPPPIETLPAPEN